MKRTRRIPRISAKKLAQHGGRLPWSSIAKRGKPKPKPKKRTPAEKARIYGTPEHIAWMRRQACCVCGFLGASVVAHTRNGGTGRKANWEHTIPLCERHPVVLRLHRGTIDFDVVEGCHRTFDANKKTWRKTYDTDGLAAKYAAMWREIQDSTPQSGATR